MKTIKMAALASALVLCLSGSALAQQNDAEQSRSVQSLYDQCKGLNVAFCDGYVSGVANALDHQRSYDPKWNEEYCPLPFSVASTYREVFINWAERSKSWTRNRYDGVMLAFWVAYFCSQG